MTEKSRREKLTENLVYASTELGVEIAQELAAQVLIQKPGMSLKEFTKVLDEYVDRIKLPS